MGVDMKRYLLASLASLALLSGSAFAASMPVPAYKAPPPPAPAPSWTGCYIDAGGGYGLYNQIHSSYAVPSGAPISGTSNGGGEGWLGRVGGGCDYQFSVSSLGNFVIGVFGDYDFTHIHGTFDNTFSASGGDENESGAWGVGGRLGYLITPSLMSYFDGGYTQARFDQTNLSFLALFPVPPAFASFPATTYNGWFIGGGTEYALNMNWMPIRGLFWRNEYRYASYDNKNVQETFFTGVLGSGDQMKTNVQTITSSLVWRFNW
jgi:outer membrane immunogenic protein